MVRLKRQGGLEMENRALRIVVFQVQAGEFHLGLGRLRMVEKKAQQGFSGGLGFSGRGECLGLAEEIVRDPPAKRFKTRHDPGMVRIDF